MKDPAQPPPKKDVVNQIQRYPDLILTIAINPDGNEFRVAVVKTREGRADPLAQKPVVLYADMERCTFSAHPPQSAWAAQEWNRYS